CCQRCRRAALSNTVSMTRSSLMACFQTATSRTLWRVKKFPPFGTLIFELGTFHLWCFEHFSFLTVQRFNDSTVQRFNGSTIQRFNDSTRSFVLGVWNLGFGI